MKKNRFFEQKVLLILFLAGSLAAKACWAPIPIKQQLSDAHLVATGKVSSTSSFLNSERFVYIKVDKILKNDLDGYPVKPGDKVKVILPKLKGYSTDFKFETGDAGLWMLKYSDGAFRAQFPMVRSSIPEAKAAKILKDLRSQYELALKTTIPERDKYLKLVLSIPVYPVEKALKKLNVPLSDDIDLSKVYVQSQYPKSNYSIIMTPDGKVLSVIPFYSTGKCFKDDLLPVLQGQSTVFLNRKLQLVPPKSEIKEKYPGKESLIKVLSWGVRGKIKSSSGKVKLAASAMKYSLMPCAGVMNGRGKWIIPPVFSHVSGFENGLAEAFWRGRVTTPNGPFRALINRRGKVVFVVKNIVEDTK